MIRHKSVHNIRRSFFETYNTMYGNVNTFYRVNISVIQRINCNENYLYTFTNTYIESFPKGAFQRFKNTSVVQDIEITNYA